jgi:hypothetical protein
LPQGWSPDEAQVSEFRQFVTKAGASFTEAEWSENLEWTRQSLQREMYLTAFGVEEARKLAIETDPMVLKAVEALPKAKSLLENAKKLIVQRTAPRE